MSQKLLSREEVHDALEAYSDYVARSRAAGLLDHIVDCHEEQVKGCEIARINHHLDINQLPPEAQAELNEMFNWRKLSPATREAIRLHAQGVFAFVAARATPEEGQRYLAAIRDALEDMPELLGINPIMTVCIPKTAMPEAGHADAG